MGNQLNRRQFVKNSSSAGLALAVLPAFPSTVGRVERSQFGVAAASYMIRWNRKTESKIYPRFNNALEMIEHCHSGGFGGVQAGVSGWVSDFAGEVRNQREKLDLYLEGQISLPKNNNDVDRFNAEIEAAKEAGAEIIRTVCLSGRRYEKFDSMASFQQFKENSMLALQRAEPIARKHKVKLAIENHKDWRIHEMLNILSTLDSEWIGVTLDTGNNISLLEDPMEVVESLAPYAFSSHIKDMSVEEYEDGFMLSEVPLGEGFLDLDKMITVIQKHNPRIKFNLEMITRDPLKIPCLNQSYWATFDQISGSQLAKFMQMVRKQKPKSPLPVISNKTLDQRLSLEEENNLSSLAYGQQKLGLN